MLAPTFDTASIPTHFPSKQKNKQQRFQSKLAAGCKQRAKHCVFRCSTEPMKTIQLGLLGFHALQCAVTSTAWRKKKFWVIFCLLFFRFFFPLQMDDKASCAPVKLQPIHQGRKRLNVGQDNGRRSLLDSEVTVSCCSGHTEKKQTHQPQQTDLSIFYILASTQPLPPTPAPPLLP